jgi:hypothetical protein
MGKPPKDKKTWKNAYLALRPGGWTDAGGGGETGGKGGETRGVVGQVEGGKFGGRGRVERTRRGRRGRDRAE